MTFLDANQVVEGGVTAAPSRTLADVNGTHA